MVLNFLCGRYSKATNGANFHDFFYFVYFFFFTKVDISQSKVLNPERLPSPFGAVLNFIAQCSNQFFSFSFAQSLSK